MVLEPSEVGGALERLRYLRQYEHRPLGRRASETVHPSISSFDFGDACVAFVTGEHGRKLLGEDAPATGSFEAWFEDNARAAEERIAKQSAKDGK